MPVRGMYGVVCHVYIVLVGVLCLPYVGERTILISLKSGSCSCCCVCFVTTCSIMAMSSCELSRLVMEFDSRYRVQDVWLLLFMFMDDVRLSQVRSSRCKDPAENSCIVRKYILTRRRALGVLNTMCVKKGSQEPG